MSDPRKAEQLLGGHAAGILTPEERARLFAAALEDQALFDALADEEALRELLADPAARARLLQALQPRPARPFWRRPGVLAMAAGLIGAAWIGLLRRPARELAAPRAVVEDIAPPTSAKPPVMGTPLPPAAPRNPAPKRLGKVEPSPEAAPAPVPPPPPPPPPPAEVASSAAVPLDSLPVAEAQRRISSPANLAPGVLAKAAPASALPPEWAFTGADRLRVAWGPGGAVYLLRRDAQGTALLHPDTERALPGGRMERVFRVPADGSTLDLYWLPSGTEHPEQLAPKAPPEGTWTRIR